MSTPKQAACMQRATSRSQCCLSEPNDGSPPFSMCIAPVVVSHNHGRNESFAKAGGEGHLRWDTARRTNQHLKRPATETNDAAVNALICERDACPPLSLSSSPPPPPKS
jgi:hypothetical protein